MRILVVNDAGSLLRTAYLHLKTYEAGLAKAA
jgi:hypothetical protein